jgi:hypothetical protein
MPIKFTCPHCHLTMTVPDELAGRRGKCRKCQGPVTVPPLSNGAAPKAAPAAPPAPPKPAAKPAPRQAAPPPSADVEAEAASLLADRASQEEPGEVKTIDFQCPMCDEMIHVDAALAGKRAPCPECSRIVKVPELKKQQKKDWRDAGANLPAGARRDTEPAPEGAWGSASAGVVSRAALVEADVLPDKHPPRTWGQRLRAWSPGIVALLALVVGAIVLLQWHDSRQKAQILQRALDYAGSDEEGQTPGPAVIYLTAGNYELHSKESECANRARDRFGKALRVLRRGSGTERDVLLGELALAQAELGSGDDDELFAGRRLRWEEVQKALRGTLGALAAPEARLAALRAVARRLAARGQPERAKFLAAQVYPVLDADRVDALASVGVELFAAGETAEARMVADIALPAYAGKKPPELRPAPVTLARLLGRDDYKKSKDPKKLKGLVEPANERVGRAEAHARKGEWRDARGAVKDEPDPAMRFRARVVLAEVALDANTGDSADAEEAIGLLGPQLTEADRRRLAWAMLRLVRVGARAGLAEDRLRAVADAVPDPGLRAWCELELVRGQLKGAKQTLDVAVLDKIDKDSLAYRVGCAELAQHNARRDSGWAKKVDGWEEDLRAYGWVGVARGLQGDK